MGRPSDGMTLEELREEYDWIYEFQSRMAERICEDADIHNLVDYVGKLEDENAKLREELDLCLRLAPECDGCEAMLDCDECLRADSSQKERKRLDYENGQLRELCKLFAEYVSYDRCEGCICKSRCNDGEIDECWQLAEIRDAAHELGVEV